MTLQRRDVIGAKICLAIISFVVIFFSIKHILLFASYGDLKYWAERVEANQPVSIQTIDVLNKSIVSVVSQNECQSTFIKAALTLQLVKIDSTDPTRYDDWSSALQNGDAVTGLATSCLPTDGNLWLRMAMVRAAIAESPREIARYVSLSQLYTPADLSTVLGRYQIYNRLTDDTLLLLQRELIEDFQILCKASKLRNGPRMLNPGATLAKLISANQLRC